MNEFSLRPLGSGSASGAEGPGRVGWRLQPPSGERARRGWLCKVVNGIFRQRWRIAALAVLFGLGGAVSVAMAPPAYWSRGVLLLRGDGGADAAPTGSAAAAALARRGNVSHLLLSHELLRRVVDRVGVASIMTLERRPEPTARAVGPLDHVQGWLVNLQQGLFPFDPASCSVGDAIAALAARLAVDHPDGSTLFGVTYVGGDPRHVQGVLAAYMDEAVQRHDEVYGDGTGVRSAEEDQLQASAASGGPRGRDHGAPIPSPAASALVLADPPTPAALLDPRRGWTVAASLLAGLVLAIGLAVLSTMLDRTVRAAEDVEEVGLGPVLAILPRLNRRSLRRHRRRHRDAS